MMKQMIKNIDARLRMDIGRLPEGGLDELPTSLWPFIWFFVRQIKGVLAGLLVLEILIAASGGLIYWYIGELVKVGQYTQAFLLGGLMVLVVRQLMIVGIHGLYDLVYIPHFGNMIRRQLYWYTVRQSLSFFQNDFAGRIANKIIQSAPALRDVLRGTVGSVWYAAIGTLANLYFMAQVSWVLAAPLFVWLVLYAITLCLFVPRVQKFSAQNAEDMSMLTGQIVDSFTNFLPTKYFARTDFEDSRVVDLLHDHSRSFRGMTSTLWLMNLVIEVLNTLLLIATAMVGFTLVREMGQNGIAAIAMALPMALQATYQSGWIMHEVSSIFENLGRVQEGIEALSKPRTVMDAPDAHDIAFTRKGAQPIEFRDVSFNYGKESEGEGRPVLSHFNLVIPAGQRVGLVGHSGAGKSTITSLLVRAYDLEGGQILIGGQDIAQVTQESVRRNITVVTQESYLFHRSIIDNIRYGKPDARMDEVEEAARQAFAHDFILGLEDDKGRKGYEAHVGERGVKLSGGQKQRIGIARAILKDAPILILDEATSALDSESEQAIQSALEGIMEGKTVIAIAHRLSTLRQMDRILVMEHGRIVEDGTHEELAGKAGGHYAKLWAMQSGGFLKD